MKDYTEDRGLSDIKLLAVDMDLTLLASDGSLPPRMAERIDALGEADVLFCPASGRPAPTLQMMFPEHADGIAFCADNRRLGHLPGAHCLPRPHQARALARGAGLCRRRRALRPGALRV